MIIISNNLIPREAKFNLEKFGEVIYIETRGITYNEISGHPDVFLCQTDNGLICAPNIPKCIVEQLEIKKVKFEFGLSDVGFKYPETAKYNAVVTDEFIIHNLNDTDKKILDYGVDKVHIHVNQAYTRCNLFALKSNKFITSDLGIFNVIQNHNLEVLYLDPSNILLPGFKNGFFGGTCGKYKNKMYLLGCINSIEKPKEFLSFVNDDNFIVEELYQGPLYDSGSIIFLDD